MGKPFRSKMKKRMNIRFIIKKEKKNKFPIQLNQTRGKKETKQREMTTYIASPYILTICVQNP